MHVYGWKNGLKTGNFFSLTLGMYYLRTKPATNAIKFTVDIEALINESSEVGVGMKFFNKKEGEKKEEITEGEEATNLTKRTPEEVQACPLRRRKRKDETQEEYDEEECLMCGS